MQAADSTSSPFVQLAIVVVVFLLGVFATVKKVAGRYFSVDGGGFGCAAAMSIGGDPADADPVVPPSEEEVEICNNCGHSGSKKCSGCKRVRYCSQTCQVKHWQEDHKFKCKQMKLLQNGEISASRKITNTVLYPYDEFLKFFNWDYGDIAPCGLLNCGNSCFANVVLQCLTSTRPLVAYLLGKNHSRGCERKLEDWCFLCELQKHVQRATENSDPFSPINILSKLPNIGGNLGYGQQEDAHEFMRIAIDSMQSACLDEFGGEKFVDLASQETTLIQHIFGGHLQSQVICCQCEMVSNRYDHMMDLTVEIQGDAESLEECLDQFTAGEWLDGDNKYKCDGCKDYVKAWKRLTVHQAPNILTVTLKRFQSGRFGKLNKRITFPLKLDLKPYMSDVNGEDVSGTGENVSETGEDVYDLYGVVVHLDMLNASFFGHYICYTKDSTGRWYRIDDCKVVAVGEEEVLAQGAYMLLYTRVTPRPGPLTTPKDPPNKHVALPKMDISSLHTNGVVHHHDLPVSDENVGVDTVSNEGENGNNDFAPASPLREDTVSLSPRHVNPVPKSREFKTGNSNTGMNGTRPSKELFSRGFLDRPYRKPLDKDRRASWSDTTRNPNFNPNPNGLSNGQTGEASTSANGHTNLAGTTSLNGEWSIKEDICTSTSNGSSENYEMENVVERNDVSSLKSNGEVCSVENGAAGLNSNGEVSLSSLESIAEENGGSSLNSNGDGLFLDNQVVTLSPVEQNGFSRNGLRHRLVNVPKSTEENGVC